MTLHSHPSTIARLYCVALTLQLGPPHLYGTVMPIAYMIFDMCTMMFGRV